MRNPKEPPLINGPVPGDGAFEFSLRLLASRCQRLFAGGDGAFKGLEYCTCGIEAYMSVWFVGAAAAAAAAADVGWNRGVDKLGNEKEDCAVSEDTVEMGSW